MFFAQKSLKNISGKDLDQFLDKGWFRMGNSIFTTQFLFFDEKMYTAIWLKIPLNKFQFKKRHLKLKKKVEKNLKVVYGQANFNEEKNELFELYKKDFKGELHSTINMIMLDGNTYNAFNTLEVCLYDNDKLVAFSFFDKGNKNIASILAAYHPDYKKYGLGIYTMIAEVEFALKNNFANYYIGYFVPEIDRFNYKYSLGNCQFYNQKSGNWLSIDLFNKSHVLSTVLNNKLLSILNKFYSNKLQSFIFFYRKFEQGNFILNYGNVFVHPLMVIVSIKNIDLKIEYLFVIEYNLVNEKYRIIQLQNGKPFKLQQNLTLIENMKILIIENSLIANSVLFESKNENETLMQMIAFKNAIKKLKV